MQLLFFGLVAGSLAALIACGLALVYGVLGVFNLALGQTVMIGGYVAWWSYETLSLSLPLAIVMGIAAGGIVAWITDLLFVEPFFSRHRFLPLVTTIALSMILDGCILLFFEEEPRSILPAAHATISFLGARMSIEQIILVLATACILVFLAFLLHATAFGRKVRALVQHGPAAMSVGIPIRQLSQYLFIGSGMLAACGGIFIGIDQSLTPVLAFPITIKAYAAVIAGGRGNVWGAILCAYGIAFLEQFAIGIHWFGRFFIPVDFQQMIALAFIMLFLLFRPQGLFGSLHRRA